MAHITIVTEHHPGTADILFSLKPCEKAKYFSHFICGDTERLRAALYYKLLASIAVLLRGVTRSHLSLTAVLATGRCNYTSKAVLRLVERSSLGRLE